MVKGSIKTSKPKSAHVAKLPPSLSGPLPLDRRRSDAQAGRVSQPSEERVRLCIKYNNCLTSAPCELCGGIIDSSSLEVFIEGTGGPVCPECSRLHAPELEELLNRA
jgi:hypothetical protein